MKLRYLSAWTAALLLGWAATAETMVFYNPSRTPMFEDPAAKDKLAEIGASLGYTVAEATTGAELAQQFSAETPKLLFWGNAEVVDEADAPLLRQVLDQGGAVVTGGGSPFWYLRRGDQIIAEGPGVGTDLVGVPGAFASGKPGTITPFGSTILGQTGEGNAQSRGGGAVKTPGAHWLPLVNDAGNPAVATCFVAAYPSGGRFFFYGSDGMTYNAWFNPLNAAGEANWRRVLASFKVALPQLAWSAEQREFRNDGQTMLHLTLAATNPGDAPIRLTGTVTVAPAAGYGLDGAAVTCRELDLELPPKSTVREVVEYLPPATAWGVYEFSLRTAEGLKVDQCLQLLPPGAVDYIDVDLLYTPIATVKRHLEIGLYSFLDRYEGRLVVDLPDQAKVLYDQPVTLHRTAATSMTRVPVELGAVERDLLVRARLTDAAGVTVHEAYLRVEASAANPALVRRDIMFRAMNGIQFVDEPELPSDLEAMRDRWPLLRGLYIHVLQGDTRRWMRDHDFTLNYGLLLTNYPELGNWGLDDSNAFGRSALELMPGHAEDPAKWLVWQHSRLYFAPILKAHPEIINLVEAVAGYQTPGTENVKENAVEGEYTNMSDIIAGRRTPPEEMAGKASHFLGYSSESVWRHREALAGRDGGMRILEPGGKRFFRIHLADLYSDLFNETLPTPEELGIADYDQYTPILLLLSHENGYFPSDRELKLYQLHYAIRCYFHMKRLDDLSAYLRAFAPEIHCVIGHDGPLVAQLSDMLYRLPYLDTQTRWLFRSAYVMANDTTFGTERHWVELGKRYGKRVGIHEEIGGGQWAPYRTEQTSFVSLFVKRAALDYRDLQVDFYHNRNKTYRVAEETAMFRGFQTAVDTGAQPANDAAKLLVVETNNSHYPSNYQGNYRWDLLMPPEPILSVPELLQNAGRYFHSTQTPLFDLSTMTPYDVVWLAAERYRRGDLTLTREWLEAPEAGNRTLVLNHVGTLHSNYLNGRAMADLNAARPEDWHELGLPTAKLTTTATKVILSGSQRFEFPSPLPVILAEAPTGAEVWATDEEGRAIVWCVEVQPGRRIVYTGLPFNNIFESETDATVLYALGETLLDRLNLTRRYAITPARWFGAGYTLNDGNLAVALINPNEYRVAMSPHGADGDAVEAASAALGETEVTFRWLNATVPHRRFRLVDAWLDRDTGVEIVADAEGSIEVKLPVNVAKLYYLRRQ